MIKRRKKKSKGIQKGGKINTKKRIVEANRGARAGAEEQKRRLSSGVAAERRRKRCGRWCCGGVGQRSERETIATSCDMFCFVFLRSDYEALVKHIR